MWGPGFSPDDLHNKSSFDFFKTKQALRQLSAQTVRAEARIHTNQEADDIKRGHMLLAALKTMRHEASSPARRCEYREFSI